MAPNSPFRSEHPGGAVTLLELRSVTFMLFMVIETFRNQDAKSIYRRFRDKGRMMPDGLAFVGSWVSADVGRACRSWRPTT
jgi:hypothetical protein